MADNRGVGWIYQGTLTLYHGRAVAVMDDCDCLVCRELDPFDPERRVTVTFTDGVTRLLHARCESFRPPEKGDAR